jgi:hypothetical protein
VSEFGPNGYFNKEIMINQSPVHWGGTHMEKAMVGTGMFDGTHLRYPSRKLPFNWLHRFHPFYGNTNTPLMVPVTG